MEGIHIHLAEHDPTSENCSSSALPELIRKTIQDNPNITEVIAYIESSPQLLLQSQIITDVPSKDGTYVTTYLDQQMAFLQPEDERNLSITEKITHLKTTVFNILNKNGQIPPDQNLATFVATSPQSLSLDFLIQQFREFDDLRLELKEKNIELKLIPEYQRNVDLFYAYSNIGSDLAFYRQSFDKCISLEQYVAAAHHYAEHSVMLAVLSVLRDYNNSHILHSQSGANENTLLIAQFGSVHTMLPVILEELGDTIFISHGNIEQPKHMKDAIVRYVEILAERDIDPNSLDAMSSELVREVIKVLWERDKSIWLSLGLQDLTIQKVIERHPGLSPSEIMTTVQRDVLNIMDAKVVGDWQQELDSYVENYMQN